VFYRRRILLRHFTNLHILVILITAFTIGGTSCSFAPNDDLVKGKPAENPDLVLTDAEYLLGIAGSTPILIHAQSMEIYQKAGQAFLNEISFTQKNEDDIIAFSGKARTAKIDTKTNNAQLTGDILIRNHLDELEITADMLNWIHDVQIFEGEPDGWINLSFGSGNRVTGRGFIADFKNATYEFMYVDEGVLSYE
jgi:LPS export ABC transporter protein LptC